MSAFERVRLLSVVSSVGEGLGPVSAHVVKEAALPHGIDMILGFDVIQETGIEMTKVDGIAKVRFPRARVSVACAAEHSNSLSVKDKDFDAEFSGRWVVKWHWKGKAIHGARSFHRGI